MGRIKRANASAGSAPLGYMPGFKLTAWNNSFLLRKKDSDSILYRSSSYDWNQTKTLHPPTLTLRLPLSKAKKMPNQLDFGLQIFNTLFQVVKPDKCCKMISGRLKGGVVVTRMGKVLPFSGNRIHSARSRDRYLTTWKEVVTSVALLDV